MRAATLARGRCLRHAAVGLPSVAARARASTVAGQHQHQSPDGGGTVVELRFYFDYRSPFSYLAKDQVYALEDAHSPDRLHVTWLPFAFPVEEGFGLPETRSRYHLNKVKYAYMDVRRWANERDPPLVIKGPQRVFDSTLALAGGLFTQSFGKPVFRAYTDRVFREFFERKLDIEQIKAIKEAVESAIQQNAEPSLKKGWEERFDAYVANQDRIKEQLATIREKGEAEGVFGVPSFVVGGELYFGNDRFHWVNRRVSQLLADQPRH